jgi:hypothetical protein
MQGTQNAWSAPQQQASACGLGHTLFGGNWLFVFLIPSCTVNRALVLNKLLLLGDAARDERSQGGPPMLHWVQALAGSRSVQVQHQCPALDILGRHLAFTARIPLPPLPFAAAGLGPPCIREPVTPPLYLCQFCCAALIQPSDRPSVCVRRELRGRCYAYMQFLMPPLCQLLSRTLTHPHISYARV